MVFHHVCVPVLRLHRQWVRDTAAAAAMSARGSGACQEAVRGRAFACPLTPAVCELTACAPLAGVSTCVCADGVCVLGGAACGCRIVAEAYNQGWIATRWIPGGVGVYMGFLLMAPRLHALGKSRGYVTISEFIFDRYLPPSGAPWVRVHAGWDFLGGWQQQKTQQRRLQRHGKARRGGRGTGLVAVHAAVCVRACSTLIVAHCVLTPCAGGSHIEGCVLLGSAAASLVSCSRPKQPRSDTAPQHHSATASCVYLCAHLVELECSCVWQPQHTGDSI